MTTYDTVANGFTVDLDQLKRTATAALPDLAWMIADAAAKVRHLEPTGEGRIDSALAELAFDISSRNARAAEAVEATGATLTDIVALYERADGRG